MGIFSTINYNNKTFLLTITISFVLTIVVRVLFFVSTISQQICAQDTFLTIKQTLEKSFGKENGEESGEKGYYKLKTGGEK